MAFTAKNQNRRNFARAMLIFLIIGLVMSVILYFLLSWISEVIIEYYINEAGGILGEFSGFGDIFKIIGGAG